MRGEGVRNHHDERTVPSVTAADFTDVLTDVLTSVITYASTRR